MYVHKKVINHVFHKQSMREFCCKKSPAMSFSFELIKIQRTLYYINNYKKKKKIIVLLDLKRKCYCCT